MSARTAAFSIPILAAIVLATVRSVPAHEGCSNATLRGSYGIEASGVSVSGPLAGPLAIVGVLTYDGFGQVSGSLTQRVTTSTGPTTLDHVPFAGTYQVNPDCTVEDALTNESNATLSVHESVIVESGRRFLILNTTAGPAVVSGTGIRQFGGDRN
jgi:hypothetical protein